jgi:methylated-DNA-protein-cysteine methyltransferase-like protein
LPKPSPAFQAMKRALLEQLSAIPVGKVVALDQMAIAMNIPTRHVAYMVSQVSEAERDLVPWHRLVPSGCKFPAAAKRSPRQIEQIRLLAQEGVSDLPAHVIPPKFDYSSVFWADEGL